MYDRARAFMSLTAIVAALFFTLIAFIFSNAILVSEYTGVPVKYFSLEYANETLSASVKGLQDWVSSSATASFGLTVSEIVASILASFSHISPKLAAALVAFSIVASVISQILETLTIVLGKVLAILITLLIIVRLALKYSPLLIAGMSCTMPFRKTRSMGLLFLSLTIIFVYILPYTINYSLTEYKLRVPKIEVPQTWGVALIEVVSESGEPLPYALVVLKFNTSVCMPCFNTSCCNTSCYYCPPIIANHTGYFVVQLNGYGKRLVVLPEGSYCVERVVFMWYNFTVKKRCFRVRGGLGLILPGASPGINAVTDGDLVYRGPYTRVRVVVRSIHILYNETGVYAFTFGKVKRMGLCTCIDPLIVKKPLRAKYRFTMRVYEETEAKIWVFGDCLIKVKYSSSSCNLTISYNIVRVESATNITQTGESFFRELYKNYVLWFNRTFSYAYLNRTCFKLPESYEELLDFLDAHKPKFFCVQPPGHLVHIVLTQNGTVNSTDFVVVEVTIVPRAKIPWNATAWYYYNYYWQYFSEIMQYRGFIEFFGSIFKLLYNVLLMFIGWSLAVIFILGMLGSPSFTSSLFSSTLFYSILSLPSFSARAVTRRLSPIALLFRAIKAKIRLKFYSKVAETTQTTLRDILYADIRRKYELLKDFYEKKLPSRRLAKLAALSMLTIDKIARYSKRAGLYYLIADVTRSRKLEKLADFMQKYPYGVRRKTYGLIVSKIEEKSALYFAKKALLKVIHDPYSRVEYDLPYLRVVADRLARKYLKKAGLSGVNPSELYRAFLQTGDRNILKASQVLAAEMVLSGVSYARVFLERGGEALVAFIASTYSDEPSREAIRAALKLGDVELAYQYALSYLNIVSATLLIREVEPPRYLYMISDKREFARAVLEWSEANRVELDEELLLINAIARSARMLDELDLSLDRIHLLPAKYLEDREKVTDFAETVMKMLNIDLRDFKAVVATASLFSEPPKLEEVVELLYKHKYSEEDFEKALKFLNSIVAEDYFMQSESEYSYLYAYINERDVFVREVASLAFSMLNFEYLSDKIEFLSSVEHRLNATARFTEEADRLVEEALEKKSISDKMELLSGALRKYRDAKSEVQSLIREAEHRKIKLEELHEVLSDIEEAISRVEEYLKILEESLGMREES